MNKFFIYSLKFFRKLYPKSLGSTTERPECEQNSDIVSQLIYDTLMSDKPCMIARFGSNELNALMNYQSVSSKSRSIYKYVKGNQFDWWWNEGIIKCLHENAGFFPPTINKVEQFCSLMLLDIPQVDVLGFYRDEENYFDYLLGKHEKVNFELLNPYFSKIPWTRALEGKKVLVIHPFAKTIRSQYKKRELLFADNLLPAFELHTIQAVQTIAGIKSEFADWFEALNFMKQQIDETEFDICLIGCGAYGFPLAAHVKRQGKKAVHLGGSLQLLFGIRGKRWENKNYNPIYNFAKLINEHWVKPGGDEKPQGAEKVEDACYW